MSENTIALWHLGFRPFYLLAAIFSAMSVGLWALQLAGLLPNAYLEGSLWHAHEMLFGFTLAVITGFLFTSVRNWSGRPTPTGATLAAIAALWVAGRVLVLTPWGVAAAVANVAFPLVVAWGIGVPLWQARNRRNYFFVGLLVLMSAGIACIHFAWLGIVAVPPWVGVQLGLDVILFIIAVMAGRVVPMFTNNSAPGARARRSLYVERMALGGILALLIADLFGLGGIPFAGLAAAVAIIHIVRLALWNTRVTLRVPLLWVLHLAYAWIPVHLLLRATGEIIGIVRPLAVHALTIGAIGGLTIGMMVRTARGHTGRLLLADHFEITCFVLIAAAAVIRVVGPLILPQHYLASVYIAATLWSGGFLLYAVRYWPILIRRRIDGAAG
ncbi:NnrS family protein [Steroidobacter denitrificans]|uniref:NnrS family protein n=1 Tax=Steroidobacter denitrificans TaxID=465721 RepID=A0A127F813_STEDE|nr:NnrS family protein [Steroidobacter denitrificans]AMN45748.1 NnrS family protein [Steroidobacter denitrificans]